METKIKQFECQIEQIKKFANDYACNINKRLNVIKFINGEIEEHSSNWGGVRQKGVRRLNNSGSDSESDDNNDDDMSLYGNVILGILNRNTPYKGMNLNVSRSVAQTSKHLTLPTLLKHFRNNRQKRKTNVKEKYISADRQINTIHMNRCKMFDRCINRLDLQIDFVNIFREGLLLHRYSDTDSDSDINFTKECILHKNLLDIINK